MNSLLVGASLTMKHLFKAINDLMAEVKYVQKQDENAFHRYKYAGEESLLEVLRPAMVKHGLFLLPSLDGQPSMDEHGNTHLVMAYRLCHVSGEFWPDPLRVPGCGNDRNKQGGVGDKGTYKALTGANKYLLFKLFQIATGDDPEIANNIDDNSVDNLKAGPVKSPPKPGYKKDPDGYQLLSPSGKVVTHCGFASALLQELEHNMSQFGEDPEAWWQVNLATVNLILERHPQAKPKVTALQAMAYGGKASE